MRVEQLTFTRFIAAVSIVIFHFGRQSFLFNNKNVSFIFEKANFGVSYFFVLSGFVLILAYGEKTRLNFYDFIINRLARIYPAYLLALILFLAVNSFSDINLTDFFLNLSMLQTWVPEKATTLNFPAWSLSVELFFYLSFPLLFNYFYKKSSFKTNVVWILSFWVVSQIVYHLILKTENIDLLFYTKGDIFYHPLMHLNEFLVGNLAGLYFISQPKRENKSYAVYIILILLILVVLLKYPLGIDYHNGFLAIIFVPLIFFISSSDGIVTRLFKTKVFVFLGEISFGIYILQIPVWIMLTDERLKDHLGLDAGAHHTLSFLIKLSILILFAAISYLCIERPIRYKIKSILARRHDQATRIKRN